MPQNERRPKKKALPAARLATQPGGNRSPDLAAGPAIAKWEEWKRALLLLTATLIAYQPIWQAGFIWDDDAHVTPPELRSLGGLLRIWTQLGATQQYYHFAYSVFWLEHQLWGDSPLGYHLVNVALHVCSALLVVRVFRQLQIPGGWFAAALFALYPIEVESVAWVSELKNTLSGAFYFGAALAFLKFDQTRDPKKYALALALFALGLLSKTVVATLPGALLVLIWWQRGRIFWKRDVLPMFPFIGAGLAAGMVTSFVERKLLHAEGSEFHFTIAERCLIAGRDIWFYLGKFAWPSNLAFFYPRWNVSQAAWWQYLFPLAAALLAGLLIWKRQRGLLAALLFFAGALFPALGFFNVFPFRYSLVADHFQYLAILAPIALLAVGFSMARQRLMTTAPFLPSAAAALALAFLGVLTWRQCQTYTDPDTLWEHTYRLNPDCWMAHNYSGYKLLERGKLDDAIAQFQIALKTNPYDVTTRDNLGIAFLQKGNVAEANEQFQQSLQMDPNSPETFNDLSAALRQRGRLDEAIAFGQKAVRARPIFTSAHYNLGMALADKGDTEGAIAQYQAAIQIRPEFANAQNNLGGLLLKIGKAGEAIPHLQEALRVNASFAEAHVNLGLAYLNQGQINDAQSHFELALKQKADDADACFNLGNILAQRGDFPGAITRFQKTLEINSNYTDACINLGNVFLKTGKVDDAMAQFQRALIISPDNAQAHNNLANAAAKKGMFQTAIEHYEAALRLQHGDPSFQNNEAWLLATCPDDTIRNGTKAVEIASKASATAGGANPLILHTLAAALAESGRFSDAIQVAQRARQLAAQTNPGLAAALQSELKLYQSGQPFHSPSPR